MNGNNKTTIIILFLVTFAIAISAIYFGVSLNKQDNIDPEDSQAAVGDFPLCFSDSFETDQIDSSKWTKKVIGASDSSGIVTTNSGNLIILAPDKSSSGADAADERKVILHTLPEFNVEFDVQVSIVGITRTGGGTSSFQNAIASLSFPYSSNLAEEPVFSIEAHQVTTASESNMLLNGIINNNEFSATIPVSSIPATGLIIQMEKRIATADTDTIKLSYSTGAGFQEFGTQTVSSFSKSGSFGVAMNVTDNYDGKGFFDNMAIYCGSPAQVTPSTFLPTITPPSNTLIPTTAQGTPIPTQIIVPTVVPTSIVTTQAPILPTSTIIAPTRVPLPQTALVSETFDKVLVAIVLIITGLVVLRYASTKRKMVSK